MVPLVECWSHSLPCLLDASADLIPACLYCLLYSVPAVLPSEVCMLCALCSSAHALSMHAGAAIKLHSETAGRRVKAEVHKQERGGVREAQGATSMRADMKA